MKLDEAIAWLTTEGRFDMEGHCCPTSSEAVNTLLDALRNGAIFTFEEVVPKAYHDKCMQIEIAKRRKLERPKGKWINAKCSACGNLAPFWPMTSTYYHTDYCPHCGADMRGEEDGND